MKAEIISIGTELLIGDVLNTNAHYLAQQLAHLGINSYYQTVVGDNPQRLGEQIKDSFSRSNLIILTGGLGPTYDDLTKEIVASVMGRELKFHEQAYENVLNYFKAKKQVPSENNKQQAMIPEGAVIFPNDKGTAVGVALEVEGKTAIMLPGPPHEMKWMFEKYVIPFLNEKTDGILVSKHLYLYGIGEAEVEEQLQSMMQTYQDPTIAPYADQGSLMIRISSRAESESKALDKIKPVLDKIALQFKEYVYGIDIDSIEENLVKTLIDKKIKIASAESCTGGMVAERITRIPGSSEVFDLSLVTYSNQAKINLLKVPQKLIEQHGAVSKEVAGAMAENIRSFADTDIGIGISGIAGPTGGTKEKPVGLVYVALSCKENTEVHKLYLSRNRIDERQQIRFHASSHALKMALDYVKKK